MATVNLLPTVDVYNDWTKGLAAAYTYMDDDHTGNIVTDTSGSLSATTTGKVFQLGFQDFTEDFSSIDSVLAVTRAGNNGRGQSFELEMAINSSSGGGTTFWSAEASGSQAASATYRTQTFTSRTTSDGSSAWTNADIDSLRMRVEITAHSGGTTRATYCYFIITYTEPVVTDNSIFFGTNF